MDNKLRSTLFSALLGLFLLLTACSGGVSVSQVRPQPTVTVGTAFQAQLSPIPSPATYRCGAWSSNNAPNPYGTITIYARLTRDVRGVNGATATAVVHFHDGDLTLTQQPVSDNGGYVTFPLPLQGREPLNVPVTVDVTFGNFPGGTVHCTPAFFTPQ